MADGQDGAQGTQSATGTAGDAAAQTTQTGQQQAAATNDGQQTPQLFTADDMQRESDRRVTEAVKKRDAEHKAAMEAVGVDAETKVKGQLDKLAEAEQYTSFVEQAIDPAVHISDLKGAYAVATALGYMDKRGKLDVDKMKANHPAFFSPTANANANAGEGAGLSDQGAQTINDWLRKVAGVE